MSLQKSHHRIYHQSDSCMLLVTEVTACTHLKAIYTDTCPFTVNKHVCVPEAPVHTEQRSGRQRASSSGTALLARA